MQTTIQRPRRRMVVHGTLPRLQSLDFTPDQLPGWQTEFYCHGHSYRAFVRARNTPAAEHEARCLLSHEQPDFDSEAARLVSCVQVA